MEQLTVSATGRITFQVKDSSGGAQLIRQLWLFWVNKAVTMVSPLYGLPLTRNTAIICISKTIASHQILPKV